MQPEKSSTMLRESRQSNADSARPSELGRVLGIALRALGRAHWLLLAALVVQLPLVLNSGFFSHDELQWLSFADVPWTEIPWNGWFDFEPFQYRPLTFNLWLLLSHLFGYSPVTMHMLRVLVAAIVALLLRATMLAFGVSATHASMAVLAFLLLPEVIYAHSWIGTYADSLCLGFALGAMLLTLRADNTASRATMLRTVLATSLLTALALASKESAVLLPMLLLLAALRRRDRVLSAAIASSAFVVAVYLVLRLDTILFAPRDNGVYAWSIARIPARLVEYAIYPFEFDRFDASGALWDTHRRFAAMCWVATVAVAAAAGWRALAVFCLGWAVALGPTLILTFSASQYAYLAAAFVCGFFAVTWLQMPAIGRATLAGLALVAFLHGQYIAAEMRRIGAIQRALYEDLPQLVATHAAPLRIKAERAQEDIILRRLVHQIPSYHGNPLGDRVLAFEYADPRTVDFIMSPDGRLH